MIWLWYPDEWSCPRCGATNVSQSYCIGCGAMKP